MAWTPYQLGLAFMMLITGSINTLSTKWADNSKAAGVEGTAVHSFDHPFLQAVGMFMGEMSCLFVFHIMRVYRTKKGTPQELGPQTFSPFIFLPAAMLDMCGTSTMYIGLNLTFASSFQMLRGAVMIFTALFSVIFLGRLIRRHMWLGMVLVVIGLIVVGLSDFLFASEDVSDINGIIAGDLLIIMAQIITATQMVYEEKYVTKHNVPPLQAVGWEGVFGFSVLGMLLVPMYFIKAGRPFTTDPDNRLENALDAFAQMGNNHIIIYATVGNVVSIAFFNFSGISVTKELSATTRMVLDSLRTIVIWVVSMGVGWQTFALNSFFLQLAGFTFLIFGMCVYNDIVFAPFLRKHGCLQRSDGDMDALLQNETPSIQSSDGQAPLLRDDPEQNGDAGGMIYS